MSKGYRKQKKIPRISIVTPSFNQAAYLEKTIQSVLSQNYPNLEYIIIDGGSTDGSVEIIKKFEKHLTYWVCEPDKGQAHAINKGLTHTTGEIFNWINSDDFLEPGCFEKLLKVYLQKPDASGWVGACRRIDGRGDTLNVVYPNHLTRENIGENWNGRQFYQPGCFLNLKHVKKNNGVDETLFAAFDLDVWIRLLTTGPFIKGDGIWANALIHPEAKTQKTRDVMFRETIRLQRKHGFRAGARNRNERVFHKGKLKIIQPPTIKKDIVSMRAYNTSTLFTRIPDTHRVITMISNFMPRFDTVSSNMRVAEIMRILLQNKYKINYIYTCSSPKDYLYERSFGESVYFYKVPLSSEALLDACVMFNDPLVWCTNVWSVDYAKVIEPLILRLKKTALSPRIIVDTMDFHYKKYMGKYAVSSNSVDKKTAEMFLALERSLYKTADHVVVVSDKEKDDIHTCMPFVKRISVVPNVHHVGLKSSRTEENQNNICFLGNFDVQHNVDAVVYFLSKVFPKIEAKNERVHFYIIGHNAECLKQYCKAKNVTIVGSVSSVEQELIKYGLFVCPLTYGAGMKGKIGSATAVGLPIVTTSIGAEGFYFTDGEEAFIADDADQFADKCLQVLHDPVCWENFRAKAYVAVAKQCSRRIISEKIEDLFQCESVSSSRLMCGRSLSFLKRLKHVGWMKKNEMYAESYRYAVSLKEVNSPTVSVVVISWRLHADTVENFKSLQKQRNQNFELIFVDNGGKEGEFEVLRPYINTYIKLNTNSGAYMARNIGAVFAKAALLIFLEDDGIPEKNFISAHILSHKKYDIISCCGVYVPKTKNPLNAIQGHYYRGTKPFPCSCNLEGNVSYRADVFYAVGGWDDHIVFGGGGPELSRRIIEYDPDRRKQIYSPVPILRHDYAENSDHLKVKLLRQKQSLAYISLKHPDYYVFLKSWEIYRGVPLVLKKNSLSVSGKKECKKVYGARSTGNRIERYEDVVALCNQGKFEKAEKEARYIFSMDRSKAVYLYTVASKLKESRAFEKSLRLFREISERAYPVDVIILGLSKFKMAEIYYAKHKFEKARKLLEECLFHYPTHVKAQALVNELKRN